MIIRTIKSAPPKEHTANLTKPVQAYLEDLAAQTRKVEELRTKASPEVLKFMKEMGLEFTSDDAVIAAEELDKIIATSRRQY